MFASNPQSSEAEQLVYQGCSDSNGSNHSVDDEIVVHPAGDTIGLLRAAAVGQIVSGPGHMVLVIGVRVVGDLSAGLRRLNTASGRDEEDPSSV